MTPLIQRPFLSLGLILLWLVLTGGSLSHLILGTIIAWIAVVATGPLELPRSRVRRWGPMIRLALIVTRDIVLSNILVARAVLAGPDYTDRNSGFLDMNIELKDPNALALLAIIVTSTPGTAWLDYRPESGRLLLHILDVGDPEKWRTIIRDVYARLLREAFE